MSNEKNQPFLIRLFAEYKKRHADSRLVLAGDGPTKADCEALARELAVEDSVFFLGNITDTDRLLSAIDIFLFPSIIEGLGIAAVEAQASGLYTLCSSALPREAKLTDRFYSLPIDSIGAWVDKIEALPSPTDRAAYADRVKEKGFDITDTAAKMSGYYRGCV